MGCSKKDTLCSINNTETGGSSKSDKVDITITIYNLYTNLKIYRYGMPFAKLDANDFGNPDHQIIEFERRKNA